MKVWKYESIKVWKYESMKVYFLIENKIDLFIYDSTFESCKGWAPAPWRLLTNKKNIYKYKIASLVSVLVLNTALKNVVVNSFSWMTMS